MSPKLRISGFVLCLFWYLSKFHLQFNIFPALFYRANQQSAGNVTVNGRGNVTEKLSLNWYLGIYSGKVSSLGLLYESLRCLQ